MRKFILLTAVSLLTIGSVTFDAHAQEVAVPTTSESITQSGVVTQDKGLLGVRDQLVQVGNNISLALQKLGEQILTADGNVLAANTAGYSAMSQNSRAGVLKAAFTDISLDNVDLAENACSHITVLAGVNSAKSVAYEKYMASVNENKGIIQGEVGTLTENGQIDAAVKAYGSLVCESEDGTTEENCAILAGGDGYGALIGSANMDTLGVQVMQNAAKLTILNSTPLNIPPHVRRSKTTDYKRLVAQIEALKFKLEAATALINGFTAEASQPGKQSRSFPYQKEILEEGGIVSQALLDNLHPTNGQGASYLANMETIVTGLQNPNYFQEKAFTSYKGLLGSIMFNLNVLNNTNFETLKWIRKIALAQGLQLAADAEEDKKEIDPQILEARRGS